MPSSRKTRRLPLGFRLLRAWFAVAGRVAPPLAQWHAARLFLTPNRRRTARPPLVANGHALNRLTATDAGATMHGWSLGDGPAVLLVHGWSGSSLDMTTLAHALATAGFRAVAFDFPAHGESPGRRSSLGEWNRVLPALARAAGGVHAILGHSLGAAAVTLAVEGGLATKGVVLVAPPLGPAFYLARLRTVLGLGERHAEGMKRRLMRDVGGSVEYFDASRAAAALEIPALILHDPADAEVPFAHGEAVARAWRDSTLVPVPDAGHTRILTLPEVTRRVVEFVGGLDSPAAESAHGR